MDISLSGELVNDSFCKAADSFLGSLDSVIDTIDKSFYDILAIVKKFLWQIFYGVDKTIPRFIPVSLESRPFLIPPLADTNEPLLQPCAGLVECLNGMLHKPGKAFPRGLKIGLKAFPLFIPPLADTNEPLFKFGAYFIKLRSDFIPILIDGNSNVCHCTNNQANQSADTRTDWAAKRADNCTNASTSHSRAKRN